MHESVYRNSLLKWNCNGFRTCFNFSLELFVFRAINRRKSLCSFLSILTGFSQSTIQWGYLFICFLILNSHYIKPTFFSFFLTQALLQILQNSFKIPSLPLCAEQHLLTLFHFIYSKYGRSDRTRSLNSRSCEGCPSETRLYSQAV